MSTQDSIMELNSHHVDDISMETFISVMWKLIFFNKMQKNKKKLELSNRDIMILR